MSATPAHHVDMTLDTNNALTTASSELITKPGVAGAVAELESGSKDASSSSLSSSSTTTSGTEPPPEKSSDIRRRTLVILSFWLIVLCLGLPIWWKTTAIPRANLPLDEMMDWADGKVGCLVLHSRLSITLTCADSHYPRPAAPSFPYASPSRQTSFWNKRPRTYCVWPSMPLTI